jgi:large subunit ribosomal protein L25
VPGIVYGTGIDPMSFKIGARDLRNALQDGSAVIDLKVGSGKARPVMVKDQQRHPVRDEIMHIDLLQVDLSETIHAAVAVELEGAEEAPGAKEGGVLEHVTRELNVEALPTDVPENIVIDVSGMESAATLHLSEITAPEGVTFLDDAEETIIATMTIPSLVELPEDEVEVETELVGEEGAEGEGADGEGEPSAPEGESGGDEGNSGS